MTPAERPALALEAAIGAGINGALSALFVFLVFGGQARIAVADLARDALPQTFMVALMSASVPTLLTRRRVMAGTVRRLPPLGLRLPANLAARGLWMAVVVTAFFGIAQFLALPALLDSASRFAAVLLGKVAYGAALGATISALAVRLALSDPVRLKG